METYKNDKDFKRAKTFEKVLRLFMILRIITGLCFGATLFLFIWCDFIFAIKMFLSVFLFALIMQGSYLNAKKALKKLHE